ncbi:MAG: hypothetical protein ACM3XO_22165 [Bacteroidota bacterium]
MENQPTERTPYQVYQEQNLELLRSINMKLGFIVGIIVIGIALALCGILFTLTG